MRVYAAQSHIPTRVREETVKSLNNSKKERVRQTSPFGPMGIWMRRQRRPV